MEPVRASSAAARRPSSRAAWASPRRRPSSSRSARRAGGLLEVVQHPQHDADLLACHPFVVQRAHQHPPAAVQLSHQLVGGHLDVTRGRPRPAPATHGRDLANLDAGRAHVGHEHRDAPVRAGGVGVGADGQVDPVRDLRRSRSRSCGPDTTKRSPSRRALGAQRGEVRAGLRLGEALAEHQTARGDLGEQALLQRPARRSRATRCRSSSPTAGSPTAAASGSRSAPRPRPSGADRHPGLPAAPASGGRSSPRAPWPRIRRASRRRRACPETDSRHRRPARPPAAPRSGPPRR